jgi:hypothetical protein
VHMHSLIEYDFIFQALKIKKSCAFIKKDKRPNSLPTITRAPLKKYISFSATCRDIL